MECGPMRRIELVSAAPELTVRWQRPHQSVMTLLPFGVKFGQKQRSELRATSAGQAPDARVTTSESPSAVFHSAE